MAHVTRGAKLVPELLVRDLKRSLHFWCELLGFRVVYDRPEDGFAFLDLDGAAIMIEQRNTAHRQWISGELAVPFGRGVNFSVDVADSAAVLDRLARATWPFFMPPEERWYRTGDRDIGVHQCIVADPDGYLVRITQDIATRTHTSAQ